MLLSRVIRLIPLLSLILAEPGTAALYFGPPPVRESAEAQRENLNRSLRKLASLQRAAVSCRSMRLVLVHSAASRMRRPVELGSFNAAEVAQMKALIARMHAVKRAPSTEPNAALVIRLELLGQGDEVLDSVEYLDVASDGLVNPQGYAIGSRLLLKGGDAAAWHLLMRAERARAIAADPAPNRRRNRPIRFASIPEPPAPPPDEPEPQWYHHENCKDDHKGHKHKRSNHYCTHPQEK